MSSITMKVSFLAGTKLEDAIKEAKLKAISWNIAYVEFNFNGIIFNIGSGANIKEVLKQYPKKDYIVAA